MTKKAPKKTARRPVAKKAATVRKKAAKRDPTGGFGLWGYATYVKDILQQDDAPVKVKARTPDKK